jgi:hypothetical protein
LTNGAGFRNFSMKLKPSPMKQYVYLCATPESLIASHLSPMDFGNYLAVGTRKSMRSQAIFFEVDTDRMDNLPRDFMNERLVSYKDGQPKRSVYLSIYRVIESVPLAALKNLYLVTDDGKVLELKAEEYKPGDKEMIHLYQQFNPIMTRVASKLGPPEFIKLLTDPSRPVSAPRLFIADLKLNKLSKDINAPIHNLPYPNPDHLRECLATLRSSDERITKTVYRQVKGELAYRIIEEGFFIGDQDNFLFYRFPDTSQLETQYYSWWRSALVLCH